MWLLQRADEGIGPCGTQKASSYFVGADALIRPLYQFPRGAASGSEKRSWSNAFLHPDEVGTIRHGTAAAKIAEDPSVPEGQPKSEQAPIRRPPCARRATAPERAKRFSLWTVHGPFLFWQGQKRNGGCIPAGQAPAGADTPEAAVRRPTSPRAADCRPYGPRMGPAEIRRADTQVRPYRSRQINSSSDRL